MGKFLKYGRVVVLLNGRRAGRKAVIIKSSEDGTKERKFGHCLVAGISQYPRKVTKGMSKKKITKRTNIKPFVKYVNLNHVFPTRYQVSGEIDFKAIVTEDKLQTADKRKIMRKELKSTLQDKYRNLKDIKAKDKEAHLKFFYKKLKF